MSFAAAPVRDAPGLGLMAVTVTGPDGPGMIVVKMLRLFVPMVAGCIEGPIVMLGVWPLVSVGWVGVLLPGFIDCNAEPWVGV